MEYIVLGHFFQGYYSHGKPVYEWEDYMRFSRLDDAVECSYELNTQRGIKTVIKEVKVEYSK